MKKINFHIFKHVGKLKEAATERFIPIRDYSRREHKGLSTLRISKFWAKKTAEQTLKSKRRMAFGLFVIISMSFVSEMYLAVPKTLVARITPDIVRVIGEDSARHAGNLILDPETRIYEFNEGQQAGVGQLGFGSATGAEFSASFPEDPTQGITINDPVSDTSIGIKPLFDLRDGFKEEGRVVYPFQDRDALKVVTLNSIGYKEDIVLNSYQGKNFEFEYELQIPAGVEARLEKSGSIGFYGIENALLGNVATQTDEDAQLLEKVRANGDKTNLLFRMPTPVIFNKDGQVEEAQIFFELEGDILRTVVRELPELEYPISIDPSVYVETARKFMRGNNETNIDFSTANELIQKGSTTGARFDSWTATQSLDTGLFDGGSVLAGGYAYQVGGATSSSSGSTTETFTTNGTFNVPATGVSAVTIKAWGAGGGGGGGGSASNASGDGGGGGYATATIAVSGSEAFAVTIGQGGTGGADLGFNGSGGGGGGYSSVYDGSTALVVAAGGGGGGSGGDTTNGADGGPGGDDSNGIDGGDSGVALGGNGATSSAGGTAGTGGNNSGLAGGSLAGGNGGDGNGGTNGGGGAGGTPGGAPGGDNGTNDYAGGGGGGSGYYGGGGGSGSLQASTTGGGGGAGGVAYFDSGATGTNAIAGSGTSPGSSADSERAGLGDGGAGNTGEGSGTNGDNGIVVITYSTASATGDPVQTVQWANINDSTGLIEPANPGSGDCTGWCSETAYDLPDERRAHSLVAYNGFLYAIGGQDDTGTKQSTVYIAKLGANGEPSLWHPTDLNPDNWVYWYTDTDLPEAVSYTSAVAYNNRMYLLGGDVAAGPTTTVRYTEIRPTGQLAGWTTTGVLAMPTARHMHTAEVYNDHLYVIGGDSSTAGSLLNTVDYIKLDTDGTFAGAWETGNSFGTARRTNGGDITTIYGAYIYIAGGCTAVSGGDCQTVGTDIQIASIFADGSIGDWVTIGGLTVDRVGYGLHAWQQKLYRIGGCTAIVTTSDECSTALTSVDYGTIYPPGEASTVSTSAGSGTAPCNGGDPNTCNLPSASVGNMLNASVIMNGYLYIMGGCTNNACTTYSSGVTYQAINSDGTLERPAVCTGGSYTDSYCVSPTSLPTALGAPGVTTFNGRIYVVGGFPTVNTIYYTGVNADGSLTGWTNNGAGTTTADNVSYTFAYSRANPSSPGTNPGNLYIFGGCSGTISGIGCSGYSQSVYKCNIGTTGAVSGCTTAGQTQIGTVSGASGTGLGAHAGAVYANYIYLMGGLAPGITDLTTVYIASFDDSNNVVESDGVGTSSWTLNANSIQDGRRRGAGFGYNGYLYITGGYDGTAALADIEFAKINVSDGTVGTWGDSSVSIDRRWGLTAPVSNSYAYVIGGCTVGAAPSSCTTRTNTIQTFQVYNNDSGTLTEVTESTGNFANTNDRIGSSAAILGGYIYVAGGENSGTATANVQYAPINANGSIGTWQTTTAALPNATAYGQLEVAGGDLYYIGGENTAGTEQSSIYYATPATGSGSPDTIRSTTYKIDSTEYSGATYTLSLNNDLESDYFVMVAGSQDESGSNNRGPDISQVRVDGDPFGNLGTTTNADEILLSRGGTTNNWVGSVTVVECVSNCTTNGFELSEVLDVSLANNNTSTDTTLASAHTSRTVPFGGYLGGGLETSESSQNNFSATAGVRVMKNSTNQIRIERQDNGSAANAGNASAADVTVYVVEWGSNWTVQEVDFDNWDAGGQGVDIASEYTTQTITSVTRDNTWVWKSPGNSEDNGLGDGAFGKVLALGDGETQGASETTVALGSEPTGDDKDDTVFVMEHSSLAVDYRFLSRGSHGTSLTQAVDSAIVSSSVSTVGNITSSEGYMIPLFYYTDSGTGVAYTRTAGWSNYHSNDTTISFAKSRSGNSQAGWIQSVDFGNLAGSGGGGDITTWNTASGGIGDTDSQAAQARTRFGATVWNDRIYVVGGLDSAGSETQTVYISPQLSSGGDIAADSWESDADLPDVARSGGTLISYANNLYYLGGNDGTNYLADVQFTSIGYKTGTISQSDVTVEGTGTTFTADMVGSTLQYITDGSTATITGFTDADTITVDQSKTVTAGETFVIDDGSVGNWTFSTSLPQYVSDADGFASNGFMYIFGGRSAASTCTNNTYVAPISANTTIATGNNPTGVGEWYQTNVEFAGDRYSAAVAETNGKFYISGGGCGTELSTDQHYYGTLRSQPQVARYSYYIDADTAVFPNAWLLNGLDNNIGARWQFGYRSAVSAPNVILDESFTGINGSSITGGGATDFSTCFANNNSGTASSTRSGSQFVSASTSALFSVDGGTSNAGCSHNTEDTTVRFDRFYFRPDAFGPLGSAIPIYALFNTDPTDEVVGRVVISAAGDLNVQDRTATADTISSLDATDWHRIEIGTESDQMTVRLFRNSTGNLEGSTPDDTVTIDLDNVSAPDDFNQARVGLITNSSGENYDIYIDDFKSSNSGWVGASELSWGQNTNFGDVTLGSVEDYIPLDGSGTDSNFARYLYTTISIDASKTFGYPDDVTRGPTVDDMTIFFVSDPNKRLRHGKTFIQGVQQPLDTPPPGY